MALSEDQIVRFSRQILLKDVGGTGQERLLSAPVHVRGSSAAAMDAAAYLSAGGCAASINAEAEAKRGSIAEWPELPSGDGAWVLIQSPRLLARSAKGCARCFELTARGPDWSESSPRSPSAEAGRLNIPVRTERSEAESKSIPRPPSPEDGLLGTTAALLYQRAVLELGEPLVGLRVLSSGAWEPLPIKRCEGCR